MISTDDVNVRRSASDGVVAVLAAARATLTNACVSADVRAGLFSPWLDIKLRRLKRRYDPVGGLYVARPNNPVVVLLAPGGNVPNWVEPNRVHWVKFVGFASGESAYGVVAGALMLNHEEAVAGKITACGISVDSRDLNGHLVRIKGIPGNATNHCYNVVIGGVSEATLQLQTLGDSLLVRFPYVRNEVLLLRQQFASTQGPLVLVVVDFCERANTKLGNWEFTLRAPSAVQLLTWVRRH